MIPDTTTPFPESYSSQSFGNSGFEIFAMLNAADFDRLQSFVKDWLISIFQKCGYQVGGEFQNYHMWPNLTSIEHSSLFNAANRHCLPTSEIQKLIFSETTRKHLATVGFPEFELWDEGLGWLAFRLIRPQSSDGYPLSIKAWGPAKNVLSLYIPIWGMNSEDSIGIVPGSHLKNYPHYLPSETQHRKDEYRLEESVKVELYRPNFHPGEALVFHPRLLHTEKTASIDTTRISLEVRILPRISHL